MSFKPVSDQTKDSKEPPRYEDLKAKISVQSGAMVDLSKAIPHSLETEVCSNFNFFSLTFFSLVPIR